VVEKPTPERGVGGEVSWLSILHADYPKGWEVVLALVVGRCASNHSEILSILLSELLTGSRKYLRRHLIAITEAIHSGASHLVTEYLIVTKPDELEANRLNAIAGLLKDTAPAFEPENQEALMQWIAPCIRNNPEKLISVLDALA
jgi:hypothetical protein